MSLSICVIQLMLVIGIKLGCLIIYIFYLQENYLKELKIIITCSINCQYI